MFLVSVDVGWFGECFEFGAEVFRIRCNSNALAGPIPTQIGQLVQLTGLRLYGNQLTGSCAQNSLDGNW